MNQKLIILVGVSGSGKTTFAKQYIKENPGTVRVNRDDMRKQILGELTQDYYSKKNSNVRGKLEKHITVLQNEQIRYWLLEGYDVIADNTHLRKNDITDYEKNFNYLADIYIKPFQIGLQEAFFRVIDREGIGTDVSYVIRQYKEFNALEIAKTESSSPMGILLPKKEKDKIKYNPSFENCYICDIDGTCASCEGIRSPYDGEKLHLDRPIEATREILNMIDDEGYQIIYTSGREDKWQEVTINWLSRNSFPFHHKIYMRRTGDTRKDTIVKKEIYEENIKNKYNVLGVFDDRINVCRMWHDELGLFVFNVNQKQRIF